MKKINYLIAVVLVGATIFNSCASKKATVKQIKNEKIKLSNSCNHDHSNNI